MVPTFNKINESESKASGYFIGIHKTTKSAFNTKIYIKPKPQNAIMLYPVGGKICAKNAKSNPNAATQFARNKRIIRNFLKEKGDFFFFFMDRIR